MYVLFVVLNEIEYLSDIITKMREVGLRGATVLESIGSRNVVENELYTDSFLATIVNTVERQSKASRVIFSLIEREEQVQKAMKEIQALLGGDLKKPRLGMMFVLPVTHMRGGELERHIESRDRKRREQQLREGE
jgi:PII-like signaling protein